MTNTDINVLNSVAQTLIDSYKGYENSSKKISGNPGISKEFRRRACERAALADALQARVLTLGGEPELDGYGEGQVYESFTNFPTLFKRHQDEALTRIDACEDYLADRIEQEFVKMGLSGQTRALLTHAHSSALSSKRFERPADQLAS